MQKNMKNYYYSSHITLHCIQAFSIIHIVQSFKTIEQKHISNSYHDIFRQSNETASVIEMFPV